MEEEHLKKFRAHHQNNKIGYAFSNLSLKHQIEVETIKEEDEENFRPTILTISGSRQTKISRNNTEISKVPDIQIDIIDRSL